MPPLARRNLFHDKVRLAVTLTGIVFAVVLIVVELGLFVGFTETTSSLVDHSGAEFCSDPSKSWPQWARFSLFDIDGPPPLPESPCFCDL